MKRLLLVLTVSLLFGCESMPEAQPDTTPKNPTVVFNAKGAINGFVFPDTNFEQTVYTRKDKRTIAMDAEYDSWTARQFLGNPDDKVIFRLDKNLRWVLFEEKKEKKYIECPLSGCGYNLLAQLDKKQDNENEDQFDYDPNAENQCTVTLSKNSFDVKATGKTRLIAGQQTNEYVGKWVNKYKDDQGRVDTNTLKIVFWNTTPTKDMQQAWKVNEQATKTYLKKVKRENNPLAKLLPDNIFMALSAFSGDTSKQGKKWTNSVSKKLAKAKGYPMSIQVEWYLDRKACPEAKPEKKALDWSNPIEAMKQSAGDYAGKQAKKAFMPNPKEPIFRYVYEVVDVKMKPVHDSVFEIPEGFKLVSRE